MVLGRRQIVSFAITALLLAGFAGISPAAIAQNAATEIKADNSWKKKSVNKLQREYEAAERDFYDAFNAVNNDEEYDVECRNEASLGSRKKVHACKANFLWKYEATIASNQMDQLTGLGGDARPNASVVDEKQGLLRGKISAALNTSPEVQKSFVGLAQAKKNLEAKMQSRR